MKRIAIFASGRGTNAEKIIEKCRDCVALIVSNNEQGGITEVAKRNNVSVLIIDKNSFLHQQYIISELHRHNINLIVLAGFLWKIPSFLVKQFPEKIINIHPALLPKFGGKGMYGMHVHKAVIESGEKESGITIHYINENYDEGEIIFQAKCNILQSDTPETLSIKIQQLEHEHFPAIVCRLAGEIG